MLRCWRRRLALRGGRGCQHAPALRLKPSPLHLACCARLLHPRSQPDACFKEQPWIPHALDTFFVHPRKSANESLQTKWVGAAASLACLWDQIRFGAAPAGLEAVEGAHPARSSKSSTLFCAAAALKLGAGPSPLSLLGPLPALARALQLFLPRWPIACLSPPARLAPPRAAAARRRCARSTTSRG